MSVKLYGWAWGQQGIGSTARLVLLALSERADNKTHSCFPTQTQLASMTGLQERSVGRAVKVLVDLGLVTRERRQRQDGSRTSDLYRMHPDVTLDLPDSESPDNESPDSLSPDSESDPTRHRVTPNPTESQGQPDTESEQEEPVTIPSLIPSPTHHSTRATFEDFYAAYPRKKEPDAARRAWAKAVKRAEPERIVEGARTYAREQEHEAPRFIKHPATWLNGGCWDDVPDAQGQHLTSTNSNNLALVAQLQAEEATHDHHQQVGHRQAPGVLERRLPA